MSEINSEKNVKSDIKSPPNSPSQSGIGVFSRLFSFSSLGTKSGNNSPIQESPKSAPSSPRIFYGVYIPCEFKVPEEDSNDFKILHVYSDKTEALKIVKKYKKARFKALNSRQEAVAFALRGAETDRGTNVNAEGALGIDGVIQGSPNSMQICAGEKASQFRGPRPQEMVQFRKLIEAGNLEIVKNMIWANPRYLVSSGDTPSILQEGSRYNALHYAVKTNDVEMCNLLLSTISDPHFMQMLFADDNMEHNKERAAVLLDLYLNTPDKAMNETPLHFAVKFGFKAIVDLLVSYPQCSRNVVNKFGDQPKDVICSRAKSSSPSLVSEISVMLRDRFYVPVFHTEDGSLQPMIGDPFSPATPPVCELSGPRNPMSPRVEIRALAGPMEKNEAESFKKCWKTPPRAPRSGTLTEAKFRLQDVHKGLEKAGRDLAQKMNIGWREYWPFLDTFTDLVSDEGLVLLEDYLKNKYVSQWNNSSNSVIVPDSFHHTPETPLEKSLPKSRLSFNLQERKKIQSEHDSTLSPMSDLCVALKYCNLNDDSKVHKYELRKNRLPKTVESDKVEIPTNLFENPGLNPYLFVEKSCIVFAKRITVGFMRALSTEIDIVTECLKSETKHLQQIVSSYMDDPRFCTVDFRLMHSRVTQLIAQKLFSERLYNDDIDTLKQALKDVTVKKNKSLEVYSSDEDESAAYRINPNEDNCIEKKKIVNSHMCCLAGNVLKWLSDNKCKENQKPIKTEEECIQVWGEMYKCHCIWQNGSFTRNHSKNLSIKRRVNSKLSTSPKSGVSRRLNLDSDEKGLNEIFSLSPTKGDNNHNLAYNLQFEMSSSPNAKKNWDFRENVMSHNGDAKNVLISEDEYDSDNDIFHTPNSSRTPEFSSSDESDYEEADDGHKVLADPAAIDVFILGECPSKMDKAVYEAIYKCQVDRNRYPYVYRWRHTIGLHSEIERDSWPEVSPNIDQENSDDEGECITPIRGTLHLGHIQNKLSVHTSTPTKLPIQSQLTPSTPPLQVSKWMRVTGPNTPRSAILNSSKNFRPNVSFGF